MKKVLLMPILTIVFLFGGTYTTKEATNHIGEYAKVCGVVSGGYYANSSKGRPTFINLDGIYPNQNFTIVIWGSDRHKFSLPERRYNNKKVCATGNISSYRGIPQIVVTNKSQLK